MKDWEKTVKNTGQSVNIPITWSVSTNYENTKQKGNMQSQRVYWRPLKVAQFH